MGKKTDNAGLTEKVDLRLDILRDIPNKLSVVDCCAGYGAIWESVKRVREAEVLGFDKEARPGVAKLDSRRFLKTGDLRGFNCVDIDAYGSAAPHLEQLFRNPSLPDRFALIYTDILVRVSGGTVSNAAARLANLRFARPLPKCFSAKISGILRGCMLRYPYRCGFRVLRTLVMTRGGQADAVYVAQLLERERYGKDNNSLDGSHV